MIVRYQNKRPRPLSRDMVVDTGIFWWVAVPGAGAAPTLLIHQRMVKLKFLFLTNQDFLARIGGAFIIFHAVWCRTMLLL